MSLGILFPKTKLLFLEFPRGIVPVTFRPRRIGHAAAIPPLLNFVGSQREMRRVKFFGKSTSFVAIDDEENLS